MGKTVDILRAKFKPWAVPNMLVDLCGYWDKNPESFAGSFEVDPDTYDTVKGWFRNNEEGYAKVRVFGTDGIQSLYAMWLYDGCKIDESPVIYLGGEREGTTILAADLRDFFSLLAVNRDYEPFDRNFCEEEEENSKANKKFRKWIKEKYNLLPAKDPMQIIEKGCKAHPDFDTWLSSVVPS